MNNFGLKIFSLGIALVLAWYVHSESNTSVRTFVSPIEIRRVPNGMIVISPLNPHAQVTVKGPSFIVSKIPLAPPVFTLVMPQNSGDRFAVSLDQAALPLPSHVDILNIDPPQIDFILDNVKEREVPVIVPRVGVINENLKVEAIETIPEKILISGPESELAGIVSVQSDPIDLREIKGDSRTEVGIKGIGTLVRFSTNRVEINIKTSPVLVQRHFEHVKVEIRTAPGVRFSVLPDEVSIALSGIRTDMEKISHKSVVAYVRIPDEKTAASSGEFDSEIGVDAPNGIVVDRVDPKVVRVYPGDKKRAAAQTTKTRK